MHFDSNIFQRAALEPAIPILELCQIPDPRVHSNEPIPFIHTPNGDTSIKPELQMVIPWAQQRCIQSRFIKTRTINKRILIPSLPPQAIIIFLKSINKASCSIRHGLANSRIRVRLVNGHFLLYPNPAGVKYLLDSLTETYPGLPVPIEQC